jgi:hypothetical protein
MSAAVFITLIRPAASQTTISDNKAFFSFPKSRKLFLSDYKIDKTVFRFKIPAVTLIINIGTADLKSLLGQLMHAVRTAVDIFILVVNTLLSYVSHLTLIE